MMTISGRRAKVLFGLGAFGGITEVIGGISLLTGFIAPPLSILAGSPFSDFTVPGLGLTALGLGTLVAAALLPYRRDLGLLGSIAAGGFLMIYEICEVFTFGLNPLTAFYFLVGALMAVLALLELRQSSRPESVAHRAA
jgi:hypothetical protein